MQKTPYIIINLQLLAFEVERFDDLYETFLRLAFKENLLCHFSLNKSHRGSKVFMKLVQKEETQVFGVKKLLALESFQNLLVDLDSFFAMKPAIFVHIGKTKEQLIPVLGE